MCHKTTTQQIRTNEGVEVVVVEMMGKVWGEDVKEKIRADRRDPFAVNEEGDSFT